MIIGPGLLVFVTPGSYEYDDIMVKELVCRIRVLGSSKYVHDLSVLIIMNTVKVPYFASRPNFATFGLFVAKVHWYAMRTPN